MADSWWLSVCKQAGIVPGGTLPGGANKQLQFNDSGVLAGVPNLDWDKGALTLTWLPSDTSSLEFNPSNGTGFADFGLAPDSAFLIGGDAGGKSGNVSCSSSGLNLASFGANVNITLESSGDTQILPGATSVIHLDANAATGKIAFFGAAGANKQNIVGAKGGNAALASLLTALAALGLISDGTT